MNISNKHIKVLTILLLVVQLCLPVYGTDYFSEFLSSIEANNAGFVCDHSDADFDRESRDDHQNATHCHELDAPGAATAGLVLGYSPVISALTSSDKGALLHGYGVPFDTRKQPLPSY